MFRNEAWSGEHVNLQKNSRKLFLHAGQADTRGSIWLKFFSRVVSWLESQHVGPFASSGPQTLRSNSWSASSGYTIHMQKIELRSRLHALSTNVPVQVAHHMDTVVPSQRTL